MFHPDDGLPSADRAELADYVHSGFDRGHMTPSGDMPDPVAQQESFSLTDVVPQAAQLNREGEAYVVTGPAFEGRQPPADRRARAGADLDLEGDRG